MFQHSKTFTAGAAVVKGRFVKLSSGNVIHCTADTDAILGVAKDSAPSGALVDIALVGAVDVEASAALTVGGPVATDTNGRAKDAETGDIVAGIATEAGVAASGGAYSYVEVILDIHKLALA